jgi:2'-5' RNA ligase
MRLFVGTFPEAETVRELERFLDDRLGDPRVAVGDPRFVPRQNWHLTFAFLGDLPREEAEEISKRLDEYRDSRFALQSTTFGVFPREASARVFWLGGDDLGGSITTEQRKLAITLRKWRPLEEHPYRPHLTIARFRKPFSIRALLADWNEAWSKESIRFGSLALYESVIDVDGTRFYRAFGKSDKRRKLDG